MSRKYIEGTSPILLFQHICYCNHKTNLIHDKLDNIISLSLGGKMEKLKKSPPNFSTINLGETVYNSITKKNQSRYPQKGTLSGKTVSPAKCSS